MTLDLQKLQSLVYHAKDVLPPKKLLDFCGAYYEPYYHFMYLAASAVEGCCVELGCEKGRGLLAMALSGKQVIGFDLNRSPELDLADYPNVIFLQQSSLPVTITKPIGLLHIDTEHSYSQASNEFGQYQHLLIKPAIVVFDDLHAMDDGVKQFFDELPYEKIQDDSMHPGCGWGVVLYE